MATDFKYQGTVARQGGVDLVSVWIPAGDLVQLTTVDRFDPSISLDSSRQGYQREAREGRVREFAQYIAKSKSLLPTSVLVNDRHGIMRVGKDGTVSFHPKDGELLEVVDGQHRTGGFAKAIEDGLREGLESFPVPVVVTRRLDKVAEMELFEIVNGKQKPVTTDLVNSILSMITHQEGDERIDERDLWRVTCQKTVDRINSFDGVWKGKIGLPNSPRGKKGSSVVCRSAAFHSSLKPVYQALDQYGVWGTDDKTDNRADRMAIVVHRFWEGLEGLIPEAFETPKDYMIQKSVGVHALHIVLPRLFSDTFRAKDRWEVEEVKNRLDLIDLLKDQEFWSAKNSDGASLIYGKKGFDALAKKMLSQYERVSGAANIV